MGWAVLYIAFGIVALWLLGEVLLQYKARLRWRLLAFLGFLGVVLGVLIPSVVVIGLGAVAFALGQTYVTLSFRRGFADGWAVSRRGEGGGKRRGEGLDHQEPALDSDLEAAGPGHGRDDDGYRQDGGYGRDGAPYGRDEDYDRDDVFAPASRAARPAAAETTAVYEPQPLPDDTGTYGIYGGFPYASAAQHQDPTYATSAQGTDQGHAYDYSGYGQQQYGYDANGQQQYANYSDPYVGAQSYGDASDASYDPGYGGRPYGQQAYGQDQYGTGGYSETPAGGVWVPQQRTDESHGGELPQEHPYPYQNNGQQQGNGNGYDEHYRF
ncbi:SCO2102 family sporulation regulator [Streptomyces sp. NPDC004752]